MNVELIHLTVAAAANLTDLSNLAQIKLTGLTPLAVDTGDGTVTVAADDGIIDWATTKMLEIQTLARVAAVTVGMLIATWAIFIARMALGKLLMTGAIISLGVWFVFNITAAEQRVDTEINGVELGEPSAGFSPPGDPLVDPLIGDQDGADQVVT